jgi:hypothetical protein
VARDGSAFRRGGFATCAFPGRPGGATCAGCLHAAEPHSGRRDKPHDERGADRRAAGFSGSTPEPTGVAVTEATSGCFATCAPDRLHDSKLLPARARDQ